MARLGVEYLCAVHGDGAWIDAYDPHAAAEDGGGRDPEDFDVLSVHSLPTRGRRRDSRAALVRTVSTRWPHGVQCLQCAANGERLLLLLTRTLASKR